MATSEAQLCNIALLRIGQRKTIDSLDEPSEAARACKALYADARDVVLQAAPWKFATRRATLALLATVTRSGWAYAYGLPSDCLSPRFIYPGMRAPPADARIPFDLEDDATAGSVLLTDQEDAELIYTCRFTVVPRFSPMFVDALAWRLAADLARSLAVKPAVADSMDKKAEFFLARAAALELRKAQEDVPPEAAHIRARG